jgi:hypothetical protein
MTRSVKLTPYREPTPPNIRMTMIELRLIISLQGGMEVAAFNLSLRNNWFK